MAFNFEDELGGMDDASLMDILGFAPTGSPAPSPVFSAPAPSPSVVGAPMAAPAPSPFVSPFNQGLEPSSAGVTFVPEGSEQPMLYGWEARKEEPPQSVLDQLRALQSQQTSSQIPSSAGVTFVPEGSEPPTIAVGRTEQPPSFDELIGYVMSGQPTMKAAGAPAPVSSSVPAYAPAPSPVYTQAPAAAPSPMNLFGMDVTQDQLADLGVSAPAAPAPSPVQAPAPSTAAQAPAPAAQQGYSAFSGDLSPELIKLMPKSGADIYGKWQFDTAADRARADYESQYGFNPESGQATQASYTGTPKYTYTAPEYDANGNLVTPAQATGLDPRYGLTDTSGLVHGMKVVPIDKTHLQQTYSFFDPKTGKPVGDSITEIVEQKQSASDLLAGLLMSAATSAIAGPMAGALGGGAMGAGLAGAALGGAQASVAGGDVLKGALTGGLGAGLGNVASGYINPLAAEAAKQVGGGTIGDIVSGAVKGAGTSAAGALVGGKSIGDALLSGALGGGASAGIGSLVGQTGLPPELAKIAAPALTAAVLGKDPATAALNAAIGQVIGAAKTGGGAEAGAMTGGEADERKGASEVADLLSKSVTGQGSLEDLEQMYAAEGDRAGTTAAIDALTKGADTAAGVSGEDLTAGTSDKTVQDLLDAGLTGAGTVQTAEDLARELGLDTGTEGTSTGIDTAVGAAGEDTNKPSSLSEQAKFLESNVEDAGDIDQLLKDYAIDTGQFQGEYSNVGALDKDYTVGDTGKILDAGTTDLADQFLGGNLDEDFYVTDRGTVKSTYTGEEGTFDADGNWVPYTGTTGTGGVSGTGGTGGTGGTTVGGTGGTKITTPTTPTAAKSGLDLNSLMALMAMMGGQEQAQAPQQQLFNLGQRKSLQDIFKDYYA